MRKSFRQISFIFGLLLTLAAFPVFAQEHAEINKKPLQDFGNLMILKLKNKEIDLTKPFSLELHGKLNDEGKLNSQEIKVVRSEGDEGMINAAKSAIEAINDGGVFAYLRQLDVENLIITLSQNENQFKAVIVSETKTEDKAKIIVSALNTAIKIGKLQIKDESSKLFLENSDVTGNGKNFSINFLIPSDKLLALINNQIDKYRRNE